MPAKKAPMKKAAPTRKTSGKGNDGRPSPLSGDEGRQRKRMRELHYKNYLKKSDKMYSVKNSKSSAMKAKTK